MEVENFFPFRKEMLNFNDMIYNNCSFLGQSIERKKFSYLCSKMDY